MKKIVKKLRLLMLKIILKNSQNFTFTELATLNRELKD